MSTRKKSFVLSLLLFSVLWAIPAMGTTCLNYGGKAYIAPLHYYTSTNGARRNNIYLSNVSSGTVSVTVKLYNDSGAPLTQIETIDGTFYQGAAINISHNVAAGTVTFNLATKTTAVLQLKPNAAGTYVNVGYGEVVWAAENVEGPALLGRVRTFFEDPNSNLDPMGTFVLNGGQPF
ncbi:hypothetical protein [Desulfocurvus sp.]|uniref:hypothetical protein n=1 Tax=Desulfocurvus sp. TaxID=2871698 RepID=UPI0025BAF3D7|nr:hypothetical protein [Desulfocurvus sp.]MCK9238823.1 hypothetical protein [Desulfocurvus sp.]